MPLDVACAQAADEPDKPCSPSAPASQLLAYTATDVTAMFVPARTTAVQWVKPGTPHAVAERSVKPARIARIDFDAGGSFAGMRAHAGANHRCHSGYIYIRVDAPAAITIGDVRRAFGWSASKFDRQCRSPLSLQYAGPDGPSRDAFRLHTADFLPSPMGYVELCQAAQDYGLPDEHPISDIWIRLIGNDDTIPASITP